MMQPAKNAAEGESPELGSGRSRRTLLSLFSRRGSRRLVLGLLLCIPLGGCLEKQRVVYVPRGDRPVQERAGLPPAITAGGVNLPAVAGGENTAAILKSHFSGWQGTPYRRGGLSRKGVDCSGFVQVTYRNLFGKELPRTVREQVRVGRTVPKKAVMPGDLIFFKTGIRQRHVGIYVEDDLFLHASLSSGVTLSSLRDPYWKRSYWRSNRL